jgi:hypothetical protein
LSLAHDEPKQGEDLVSHTEKGAFHAALKLTGMSHREAAAYLSTSVFSVQSYSSGRGNPSDETIAKLYDLWMWLSRTDNLMDRQGRPLPEGALSRRSALREAEAYHRARACQ